MPRSDHVNPCIKVCRFNSDRVCTGCYRTRDEVKGWKALSKAARAAINDRVRPQMAARPDGRAARRVAKLDRKIFKLNEKLARLRAERDDLARPPG